MGERGREHVRANYGLARVAERWQRIYTEAMTRRGLSVAPAGTDRPEGTAA